MTLTGERLDVARRLRTPTASEWRNGRNLDAGLAMIVSSNIAHAQRESVRRWVTSLGPGTVTNAERGYTRSSTPMEDRPDPGSYSGINSISWDVRTAQRFGTFLLVRDREVSGEPARWRRLRVSVDADASALTLLVALTAPGDIPGANNAGYASRSITAGRDVYSLDVDPALDVLEQTIPARRPDTAGAEESRVAAVDLWVGWYSASGTSSIYSITAGEIR